MEIDRVREKPPASNEDKSAVDNDRDKWLKWMIERIHREVGERELRKLGLRKGFLGPGVQQSDDVLKDQLEVEKNRVLMRVIETVAMDNLQKREKASIDMPEAEAMIEEKLAPIRSQLCGISQELRERSETFCASECCRSWVDTKYDYVDVDGATDGDINDKGDLSSHSETLSLGSRYLELQVRYKELQSRYLELEASYEQALDIHQTAMNRISKRTKDVLKELE